MLSYSPGSLILYLRREPESALWPAVVITDTITPGHVRKRRPHGYYTPVLLLADQLTVEYALTTEVRDYDPFFDEEIAQRVPGLMQAYRIADSVLETQLDLDYWRGCIEAQWPEGTDFKPGVESSTPGASTTTSNLEKVVCKSLAYNGQAKQTALPSPSLSPAATGPAQGSCHTAHAVQSNDIRDHFKEIPAHLVLTGDMSKRVGRDEKNVIEDIEDCDQFVEFLIGPEKVPYLVPKNAVFSRRYFSSRHLGMLQEKGQRGWSFVKPSLASIRPAHFDSIAEYLSDGDFGVRVADTDGRRALAMEQCVYAWVVAEDLGMEDLLQHIVGKLEIALPFRMEEILPFATCVYRQRGTPLPAHDAMKSLLVDFITDHFFEYIKAYSDAFSDQLQRLPELAFDVFEKMTQKAKEQDDLEQELE